jgi:pterin-4a-carbinolamine dehydratase
MKKTNVKTKVIAGIMAVICSVSALGAISAVSASAAVTNNVAISAQATGKACLFTAYGKTSYGYDWDYRADSTAAKISCTYDFKTNRYTFKAVGQYAGVTNAVLKYATIDGKWHNVPIRFTTDKARNVTGVQTAKEFITNNRYSG